MFQPYYGMSKNPFDKQAVSVADAFPSKDHREMTDRLAYLKDRRGIGVFTSPPGYGKTFALRCFAGTLDRNLHESAYVCLSTVSVTEFYRQLCAALGVDARHGKPAMFRAIQERLHHLFREKRKPLVLILDEAHELSAPILTDLKMIMNHDYDSVHCFTIALVGEPHLNRTLQKPIHEALRQRLVIHYGFSGLSDDETERYVMHKLRAAGAAPSILGEGALAAVAGYARGCPRLIDNLMNEALMLGAQLEKPTLDTDIFMAAANSLALG